MADEFYLPQELINHIQSFLGAKEHAQTSILSKSWYSSWPIRPVLVLDENSFSRHPLQNDARPFSTYSTETLNRYKTLNLKVDRFLLLMNIGQCSWFFARMAMDEYEFSRYNTLASHLITSALELGVSEIELKIKHRSSDLDLRYDLPSQIFACSSLIRLSVERYVIDGVIGNRVLCSRLKSLVLYNVKITDNVVGDILFGCSLIENLDLCHCVGLNKLNLSKSFNLVELRIITGIATSVQFMDLVGMNVSKFHCLRRLKLQNVRIISAEFFTRFGSMFPCVEDLTLGCCGDYEEVMISSHSIKRLSLYKCERLTKVQLNVPNISKFVFENGKHHQPLLPLLFDNVSRDWESDVKLDWSSSVVIDACWFVNLRKFLISLTLSKISLSISFSGEIVISGEKIPCFRTIPGLKDVTVCTCCSPSNLNWLSWKSIVLGLSKTCCANADLIIDCMCEG